MSARLPLSDSAALVVSAALLACVALVPVCAQAAPPTPPPAVHVMHLVRQPNGDYTMPVNELADPAWTGSVVLHPAGPRTIVTVRVHHHALRAYALELHPGSDCSSFGAGNAVALNPATDAAPSRTVVSLPITNLTSQNYVVAVRDATNAQRYREACAHL